MSQLSGLTAALRDGVAGPLGQFGRAPGDARPAAVLILLTDEPDPAVLFTERAGGLRAHAGQISFPGGYRGPGFQLGDLFIWGMTAHLLDVTLRVAGWERSWDRDREAPVPGRFLRD